MFFLGWHEIRETLYEGLPPDMVAFGRKYDSYEEEEDGGIIVRFKVGVDCGAYALRHVLRKRGRLCNPCIPVAGWQQHQDEAADRR